MAFYTGKSADGSDAREVEGMYINPLNPNEWSNKPYPTQQKIININTELRNYMNGIYCLNDVFKQIQGKKCTLPKRIRDFVLSHYNN